MNRRSFVAGAACVVAGRRALPAVVPLPLVEADPQTPSEYQEQLRRNYLLSTHVFKMLPVDRLESDERAFRLGRLNTRAQNWLVAMEEQGFSEEEMERVRLAARMQSREDFGTSRDPFINTHGFALLQTNPALLAPC